MGKVDDGYFLLCLVSELKQVRSDENLIELYSSKYSSGLGRMVLSPHITILHSAFHSIKIQCLMEQTLAFLIPQYFCIPAQYTFLLALPYVHQHCLW
jgi:hypothetical protein